MRRGEPAASLSGEPERGEPEPRASFEIDKEFITQQIVVAKFEIFLKHP